MSAEQLFLLFVLAFSVLLIFAGLLTRRWIRDSSDFILAGREISLILNIFGVAAIGFAGTSIALGPAFTLQYGFWTSFIAMGVVFALGGLGLYGIFFTNFIRNCGAQTLPEWLEMRFDSRVRLIVTIGTILGLAGIMANNVVSMAGVVTGFTGWSQFVTVSAIFFLFMFFSYLGGFWAITLTDFLQISLGLVAIPLLVYAFFANYGDISWLEANWTGEAGFLQSGLTGETMPIFSLQYPSLLTFIFIFAIFLVWGNNYYWLRAASCRSARSARLSFFWASILLCLFFYLPLCAVGLFAGAANPELFKPLGQIAPTAAYGVFLQELPVFLASFLLLTPLAAGVSTSTTAHIGASSVAVRDIYQKHFKPKASSQELLLPSRVILLILGLLVWLLNFYPGGPVYLFAFATAWLGPPSLLVFLGIVWRKFSATAAFWSAILSMATMFFLTLLELLDIFLISNYMHVGIAGYITALIPAFIISYLTPSPYFGRPNWTRVPEKSNREEIVLAKRDYKILTLINVGYNNMAELSDLLGLDTGLLNHHIEKLDRGGLIIRDALKGAKFYNFKVSPKGKVKLPNFNAAEEKLLQDNLDQESLKILSIAATNPEFLRKLVSQGKYSSLKLSVILAKLIRQEYLAEGGLWRRTITITTAGQRILEKHQQLL